MLPRRGPTSKGRPVIQTWDNQPTLRSSIKNQATEWLDASHGSQIDQLLRQAVTQGAFWAKLFQQSLGPIKRLVG